MNGTNDTRTAPAAIGSHISRPDPGPDPFDHELLSAEQERELARSIEAGWYARWLLHTGPPTGVSAAELAELAADGEAAWRRFLSANLRLVAMISRRAAARYRQPESELFQEGFLGLLEALRRFDHRQGYRFATYALPWIRAGVSRAAAAGCGTLPLGPGRAQRHRRARQAQARLTLELGREPTSAELAARLECRQEAVAELLSVMPLASLDALLETGELAEPRGVDIGAGLLDRPAPVADWFDELDALEARILRWRCGFGTGRVHAYAEISRNLGISVGRVRRIEQRALERLRGVCSTEWLPLAG